MSEKCPVKDCPADRYPCGCGYASNGLPCRHPKWREEWERQWEKAKRED